MTPATSTQNDTHLADRPAVKSQGRPSNGRTAGIVAADHIHFLLLYFHLVPIPNCLLAAIEKAMERDARTVFVTNLPLKVTDRELYRFFEKAGRVNDIRLIHDRNTRRSKGIGYVEYREFGSVHKVVLVPPLLCCLY